MTTLKTLKKIGFFEKRTHMLEMARELGLENLRLTSALRAQEDALYLIVKTPPESEEMDEDEITTLELELDELFAGSLPVYVISEQAIKYNYEMTPKEYEFTREKLLHRLDSAVPILSVRDDFELDQQFLHQKASNNALANYNPTFWLYGVDNISQLSSVKFYNSNKVISKEETKEGELIVSEKQNALKSDLNSR